MSPIFAVETFGDVRNVDPWILAFSAVTVFVTIFMGFWSAKKSKTASDFFVAGRSVSVGWNASAISGEYLSAASFMGIAGMVMSSGYDALWYPVCYACGYLFLLLFIAGPLRRFGAYTIPDFAEGRYDSPLFRKIAVCFVLFIGFFYTMPQMKGAGVTLAYIFPGLPYQAGVLLVGAVITLNVALGGMKGITLVQAFQYWAKMFAISVPIFVLMAVYGNYGKQLELNTQPSRSNLPAPNYVKNLQLEFMAPTFRAIQPSIQEVEFPDDFEDGRKLKAWSAASPAKSKLDKYVLINDSIEQLIICYSTFAHKRVKFDSQVNDCGAKFDFDPKTVADKADVIAAYNKLLQDNGIFVIEVNSLETILLGKDNHSAIFPPKVSLLSVPEVEQSRFLSTSNDVQKREVPLAQIARKPLPEKAPADSTWISPFGPLTTKAAKAAKLSPEESKPYSLLYTYSLIIALVCGTAGLPHILVRFYTNPDGVAAKRTTMWVMILIGIFYVFPPVFGVMGRNLMPELYNGLTGVKGTDGIVLKLPIILREKYGMLGSILSGITCAGAFAAFMSTFSGLLVSMTGALAHDVYGRILKPKSTPEQRLRMFKFAAVLIGGVAIVLGSFVEPLEINFMVGQAFAIAAASYFPLLFMSVWWRGMTMRGAAVGMLTGGLCALGAVTLTNVSNLALDKGPMGKIFAGFTPLNDFWAHHPLLRILCEQPAIWTVPLAIGLMVVVGKLTRKDVPSDVRMKMLVLHAPEKLGLKQEYIQEHQPGH